MGKVIYWEMCKKFKFDQTNKWYMHNPAAVLENDTHKLFDILTDHLISARRPDLIIIYKKKKENLQIMDFTVPADHRIKLKESKKKDTYLEFARELKKTMEREGDNYTNRDWCFWYIHQRIIKGLKNLEIGRRVKTIQTTLLRTAIILRRTLETWGDLLSFKLQ